MTPSSQALAARAPEDDPYQTNLGASGVPVYGQESTEGRSETRQDVHAPAPRTKHMACILCRRRKLRCDGTRPRCTTCSRLGHRCTYDEVRRKSGPKRGYVKHLETRLNQVETLLQAQDDPQGAKLSKVPPTPTSSSSFHCQPAPVSSSTLLDASIGAVSDMGVVNSQPTNATPATGFAWEGSFTWEVVSLGLEESLPNPDVIDEMNQIYFAKVHQSVPIIHRPRYFASMDMSPSMRPPVCLRYAMWTHVALMTLKYRPLVPHLYARARKYAERDEVQGFGEGIATLSHAQAWCLIADYELKMLFLVRAWMSTGRAVRLSLLMGLNRQDAVSPEAREILPPTRVPSELEERRRTFWLAFCQDRCGSIGTGWPMTIDEGDIQSNLPASEKAFLTGTPEETPSLEIAMSPTGASKISEFGGIVVVACLNGRSLVHIHQPKRSANTSSNNRFPTSESFWSRHRAMDELLSKLSATLSPSLQLPAGSNDSNVIFSNVYLHAAAIYLYQGAISKAESSRMPQQNIDESRIRCRIAAAQIVSIMHHTRHIDPCSMATFLSFCLYVAARVFVEYLKEHKDNAAAVSSLRFLLATLRRIKLNFSVPDPFFGLIDIDLKTNGVELPADDYGSNAVPSQASSAVPMYTSFSEDPENESKMLKVVMAQLHEEALPMRRKMEDTTDIAGATLGMSHMGPQYAKDEQHGKTHQRVQDYHILLAQEEHLGSQATDRCQDRKATTRIVSQQGQTHRLEPSF